jgi:hypothetical protein
MMVLQEKKKKKHKTPTRRAKEIKTLTKTE